MKKSIFTIARLAFLTAIVSLTIPACDFLDVVPDDVPTMSHAFEDKAQAEKYLFTCYSYLPPFMDATKDPAMMGSGEFLSYETGNGAISLYNYGLISGMQNTSSPICNNWESDSWYESPYRGIRVCNTFLENIDKPYDLGIIDKTRWIAEVKFLKAYYHYCLIRMYGPIIICDTNKSVDATAEDLREYRQPLDSCFAYCERLIDEACKDLPEKIENEAEELGRITKPIALAVKAKMLVLKASPLFNGNKLYTSIRDNKGTPLFPAEYDAKKWEVAAKACKEAIQAAELAGHNLYTNTSAKYALNDELALQLQIRNKIWEPWNSDIIWGFTRTSSRTLQYQAMPRLHAAALKNSYVKGGALAPTQFVADLFYTENGVPMDEDKDFDYAHRFETRASTDEEKYKVATSIDAATGLPFVTAGMHFHREPRFYASLGFDGNVWWGNGQTSTSDYSTLYKIAAKYSQLQGETWSTLYSVTGYFAKKLIAPETTFSESSFTSDPCPLPLIRMSDLYLLYAEALNEVQGPTEEVYAYVDAIREKAGLKGVVESWRNHSTVAAKPESKDGMRQIIHRERMIELAMEGQTFWDIRRWMEGTNYWNGNVTTWNVTEKLPGAYYMQITLDYARMKFAQKDYLWPISQSQLSINPNLVQNYGW